MSDSATTDPPAPDLTGRTVGDFQVLRKIGQGGMGQVYLARQLSLKREVALKILNRDLSANATALKRFQAEAEAVARVTHANIVQVYATGEFDGLRYMALEYVEGRNLRDYLLRKGPPDLPVALTIMKQVAAALQRASEHGLVHRDIKPENILVTRKVEVKVADFGLSRYFAGDEKPMNLTQSGMTLGTPLYMSPEQVQGQSVDHRSDIYSFGITCYHLLAGHPPFRGTTPFEVALQHVQNEAEPLHDVRPDLPLELCAVVHKMIAKQAADRYQSARDIIRDLAKVAKGLSVGPTMQTSAMTASAATIAPALSPAVVGSTPSVTTVYLTAPTEPPGRWMERTFGSFVLIGLALGGWWGYDRLNPPPEPKKIVAEPGLPDVRPPEPVVTARERELIAKRESRAATALEWFEASVELGLLYIKERRLDEAEKVFKEVELAKSPRPLGKFLAADLADVVGRFGQAIVLSQRDKAKESNDLFEKSIQAQPRPLALARDKFLLDHPTFGQAVADALNRNAENLSLTKLPDRLEWLRTPGGLTRGPKN